MMYFKSVSILMTLFLSTFGQFEKQEPVNVIITAGQSNTDGRISNADLPEYIIKDFNGEYKYCKISRGGVKEAVDGTFTPFWPSANVKKESDKWAYDAVTYYWLEKSLKKDFYVIKWSLGGTAIDTAAVTSTKFYWQANKDWLKKTTSTIQGGNSLLLSFEENIGKCIDNTLSKLKQGYKINAFLWHQGESDYNNGKNYYTNLKNVVTHVRNYLIKKTGNSKYADLPFICGTVSRLNSRYNKEVEDAMYQLAKDDKNFYVIDMSQGELQGDQLHFTKKSGEYLGTQMFNKLVDLGVAGKAAKKITYKE